MIEKKTSQPSVLLGDFPRGGLDFGGGLCANLFAGAVFGFEFREVLFSAGAGAALVVADAGLGRWG
jgi:prolipoprotein diacylglyceryltransferase